MRIFEYQNGGQEVRLESPIDKLIMSVSNFAAELDRAKASQRTRDALQLKAQRGHVAGGVVFGYRNVPVLGEGDRRSHVVREVRDDEAATVRRIFEMATAGVGLTTIAMALNADGVRSPRAREGRHVPGRPQASARCSSMCSTRRHPLGAHQEAGRLGPSQATRAPGQRVGGHQARPPPHRERRAVGKRARLAPDKAEVLRSQTRPAPSRRQPDSKYLLSGFVRCGVCGGSIVQSWQALKSVYRCWYNWSRGPAVCTNTLTVPQDRADLAVLRAVERDVLDPQVVEAALVFALDQLTRADTGSAARREDLRTSSPASSLSSRATPKRSRTPGRSTRSSRPSRSARSGATRSGRAESLRAAASRRAGREGDQGNAQGYLAEWTAMARGCGGGASVLREVLVDRIVFRPSRDRPTGRRSRAPAGERSSSTSSQARHRSPNFSRG